MNKTQQWIAKNLLGVDVKALAGAVTSVMSATSRNLPVVLIGNRSGDFVDEGYAGNDTVYSILMIAREKEGMAPWNVYKIKNESSLKDYEAELSKKDFNFKKALDHRTKALELYTGDGKLNQLLEWPNEKETFSDLVANSGIYKRSTGNRFIKATLLDLGSNKGKPQELHLLPSQFVTILGNGAFPSRALGYQLEMGEILKFNKEEVMHDRLPNPSYDGLGSDLYGMSPLRAARLTLSRNKSSGIASVKSFDNLGPDHLIFVDDNRIQPDDAVAQAAATSDRLRQMSGLNRQRVAVSGYKMGSVALGLSPHDLEIITSEKWDTVKLANVYNFPHILLLPDHTTFNNLREAEKALTTRCALPYLVSFRNSFNKQLRTDWGYKGESIYVDFDLSVYSELQADMKELTSWVKDSWWLTPRMRYELQQLNIPEQLDGRPEMDMMFVPSGLSEIGNLNPETLDREMDEVDKDLGV